MAGRNGKFLFSMCLCRYCPECKNDSTEVIAAGEKLRFSKKKSNMMSKKSECNRDWGKVGTINIAHNVLCLLVHVVTMTVAKYLHLPTVQFFLPNQNFIRGGWNFPLPEIFLKLSMVILSQIAPEAI